MLTEVFSIEARHRSCLAHGMHHSYAVYIMTNRRHGTLYTGVTSDLLGRVWEHREGALDGFTKDHGCRHLVWFDYFEDINVAIAHEKRLKRWQRAWKEALIEKANPEWRDLWFEITAPDADYFK